MLNERKVRLMTRMAMYETKQGPEDMKISTYNRKDYTSFQTVITIIWMTIGYAIAVAVGAMTCLDVIMDNFDMTFLIMLSLVIVTLYLVLVIGYAVAASKFYGKKHDAAVRRMKMFNHDLTRLNKMYERER